MASCSPLQLLVVLLSCTFSLTTQKELDCSNFLPHSASLRESPPPKGDKFALFDWALAKELHESNSGNLIVSPISLKIVLAMLYEGASGKTAQEISQALNLDEDTTGLSKKTRERFSLILKSLETSDNQNKVKIGTHVFIDKSAELKKNYQCSLKHYYNSAIEKVNFSNTTAAVATINAWASNITEGNIQDLVSDAEAHASTIMLLLNAVYFKGLWEVPFPENQSYVGPFYLNNKESVNVTLMNTKDTFYYNRLPDLDAQIIRLPYLGGKYSMYVILPSKESGLDALVKKLGPNNSIKQHLNKLVEISIDLTLPKFEFHSTTSLGPTLEKLNIKTMFSSEADLTKITNTRQLVVSNVLQKAGISVAENGTVAYAATVIDLVDKFGGAGDSITFKADHPFLFLIEDESVNTTLFVGKVVNPGNVQESHVPEKTQEPVNPEKTKEPVNPEKTKETGKPEKTEGSSNPEKVEESGDRLGNKETVPETPVNKQPQTPGA